MGGAEGGGRGRGGGRGLTTARPLLQSFQAALQTQWSWMLQLCCCIEAHLKENTAYFQVRTGLPAAGLCRRLLLEPLLLSLQAQITDPALQPTDVLSDPSRVLRPRLLRPIGGGGSSGGGALDPCRDLFLLVQFFSDVREAEEQLRKLQETLRRKYTCDRSITVTRLEDLLQDAQVSRPPGPPPDLGLCSLVRGRLCGTGPHGLGSWGGAGRAGAEVVGVSDLG